MKKLSALILVLAMIVCTVAACGAPAEKAPLDKAKEYLNAMYRAEDGSVTPDDYQLVGIVNIDGGSYTVTWTADTEAVQITPTEDGKKVNVVVDKASATEVPYTLTATLTDDAGKTAVCTFKHTVPQFKVFTIPEVLASADGASVVVNGTVSAIDTAWSDEYKNISVYISDDAGNKILCYRLGTNVTVGDVVTVKGTVGSYNGAKQLAQGATAEITGHVEIKIDFPEMTLAEATAAADGTNVSVSGVVTAIAEKDAWSDQYNNMSVTVTDASGSLYVYRLGTKVELGDAITIKGTMGSYKEAKQIAQGATAEITGKHATVTIPEAAAAADGTLVIVSGTVKEIAEKDAWSDKYNNMSVTIADADGKTLYIYRLGTKVEIGDTITVYGAVGSYNGAKQIAQGGFAEITK